MTTTLEELTRELEHARRRIALLEGRERGRIGRVNRLDLVLAARWRLTPNERRILLTLLAAPHFAATLGELRRALSGSKASDSYVRVLMGQLRPKLRCDGVLIVTLNGIGYELRPESVKLLRRALREEAARMKAAADGI